MICLCKSSFLSLSPSEGLFCVGVCVFHATTSYTLSKLYVLPLMPSQRFWASREISPFDLLFIIKQLSRQTSYTHSQLLSHMPEKQWSRREGTCSLPDVFYWLQAIPSPSLNFCWLICKMGLKTTVSFVKMFYDSSLKVLQKRANYKCASHKCANYVEDYYVHGWSVPKLLFKIQASCSFQIYGKKADMVPLSQSAALRTKSKLSGFATF